MVGQTLNVRRGTLDDAALAAYREVIEPGRDTSGGLAGVDDVLRDAELFEVVDGIGQIVARYALRVDRFANGAEGVIVAAVGGRRGISLANAFIPVIERQFAGCTSVKVETRRRGLVARLAGMGYRVDGFILRKRTARYVEQ